MPAGRNSRAAPVLVELFGTPGAGKTTLVHAAGLPGLLTNARLSAAWRRRPAPQKAVVLAGTVLSAAVTARAAQLAVRAPLASRDSLSRLARLVAKSHWVRVQTDGLLLEEGFLQDLWSILYSAGKLEPERKLLRPLIRSLYDGLDARIVHIDVDPETAVSRIAARAHGKSRFDGLPETALRGQIVATAQLSRTIAAAAGDAGLHVDTLDGSMPMTALVERLRSIVAEAGVQHDA